MALTLAEQETSINFDNSSQTANVITYDRALLRKLRANPAATELRQGTFEGSPYAEFLLPKRLIAFRNPPAPRPVLTEGEQLQLSLKMKGMRAARGTS